MDFLSSNKIAVVDLTSMKVSDLDLDDELVAERIGGAGITSYLYEKYADENPIVFGTGLLTGTLVPGSSLGIITAKSPRTGDMRHAPFCWFAAQEMKYAGFDYIVVKGVAEKPVYLWLHDGIADINDASEVWGKTSWETTDFIRNKLGEDLIQLLTIGPAGEKGSDLAQILINYWPSGDQWGLGKILGEKRLKAVTMRGMGLLEVESPESFANACIELTAEIKKGPAMGKRGCCEFPAALGEEDVKGWISSIVHRDVSCFNCPYPTNTFVKFDDNPKTLEETDVEEPGFLISDIYGLLGFKKAGLSAEDSCRMLQACAKYGVDAVAAAELAKKAGKTTIDDIKKLLPDMKGPVESNGKSKFSPWIPNKPLFADFGGSADDEWWVRRQAVAHIFGIHPIFALMSPELSEEKLIDLVNMGTGLEITQEVLDQAVANVIK